MYKNYYCLYDTDMAEIKTILSAMCQAKGFDAFCRVILNAVDGEDLKRYLARHETERVNTFIYLKQIIEQQHTIPKCEKYVVMMKLVMPWNDPWFTAYRHSLKKQILNGSKEVLCASNYCVLRHLFKTRKEALRYLKTLDLSNKNQQYHLCLMYLMEEQYNEVYPLMETIDYTGELCKYDRVLRYYSPIKYRRSIEKSSLRMLGGRIRWTSRQLLS